QTATDGVINPKPLTIKADDKTKIYDGLIYSTFTATYTGFVAEEDKSVLGGSLIFSGTAVNATEFGTYTITPGGLTSSNYAITFSNGSLSITPASTFTTLTLSAPSVRYMDNVTFTAVIRPLNTASALTGSVTFTIGTLTYTAPVVPIPEATDGSVQAMVIQQLPASIMPGTYDVTATFTSTNANYSSAPPVTKPLTVIARTADPYLATGFYTGDLFAWTTSTSTSTATVTLVAAVKDANDPKGDVRGAKVSFYFVNGTTYTAIPSAQNLPVGLIDVTDGSVGTASAIVQLNIGSANAASFLIAVKVTGAYSNNMGDALSQKIVSVSKPITGGYIFGSGDVANTNSSGYIMGKTGLTTDYEFDIQYTKSGTNPKGKVNILVRSMYTKDGILDSKLHTYIITTNAIALLNVGTPLATGTFSAKANLVEQLGDGESIPFSTVAIEGGATFQMVAFQNACDQQIAITLYRKAGGVWFSSYWNATKASSTLQPVSDKGIVAVAGGGICAAQAAPALKIAHITTEVLPVVLEPTLKAYPNPFKDKLFFDLSWNKDANARLEVYDVRGAKIATVFNGPINANESYRLEYVPNHVVAGMLIYRLFIDGQVFNGKVVYNQQQ
ncbi:MAG TPA: hypothetical protein DHV48_08505, partial [Prolixibacteraceae bacterium]|nr:hypothetical protein [Prolixibacteraceae bacterium]